MSRQDEDDAWRSIVENYGERAEIDPAPSGTEPEPSYDDPDDRDDHEDRDEPDDDRFVPPPPPPLPRPTPVRLAAWIGVFGAPAVLLVAMVLALPLPGWLGRAWSATSSPASSTWSSTWSGDPGTPGTTAPGSDATSLGWRA